MFYPLNVSDNQQGKTLYHKLFSLTVNEKCFLGCVCDCFLCFIPAIDLSSCSLGNLALKESHISNQILAKFLL